MTRDGVTVRFVRLGRATIAFRLLEHPSQPPTNEHIVHILRQFIDQQALNLVDPNGCLLMTISGSLAAGRETS